MRKVWLVIKREYLTRVRTRVFVFTTVLIPILLVAYIAFIVAVSTRQGSQTINLAIVDETGGLAAEVAGGLKAKLDNGQPAFRVEETLEKPQEIERSALREKVLHGELNALLVIPANVLGGKDVEFYTQNPGDLTRIAPLRRAVGEAVVARRLSDQGIHVKDLAKVTEWVDIRLVKLSAQGESRENGQTLITGFIMAMMLYGTLLIYGISTMRSVLEEKTTRIVEILVSSIRPVQLLTGKILGVAAVALTQYLIWAISGSLVASQAAPAVASMMPAGAPFKVHIPPSLLAYAIIFFLGGYFFYSSLFATVGAVVSNDQDAQQLQFPIMVPLILSLILLNVIIRDPNSTISVVLSMIPFFAPILMIFRITLQTPPHWQIALSIFLLFASTGVVLWFSARIYRVGILMYGKRPSVVEILKWLKYS